MVGRISRMFADTTDIDRQFVGTMPTQRRAMIVSTASTPKNPTA